MGQGQDQDRDRDSGQPPATVHLSSDVNIRGVVIPTWVAITLSCVAALSAVVVLLTVILFKNAADSLIMSQGIQTKEIRVLDLHIQDVENVLIRNGLAKREDFAHRPEQGKSE